MVDKFESKTPYPKDMLLEVTNACNDKCIFCANSKMTRKRGIIKPELAYRVIKEGSDLGVRSIGFYATGEPLLNKDLEKYITFAKTSGYEYTYLTTNGGLLSCDRAESLLDAGLDSLKISLNAACADDYYLVHGVDDFDSVIKNIRRFNDIRAKREHVCSLYISCVKIRQLPDLESQIKALLGGVVDEIAFDVARNVSGCMGEIKNYLSVNDDGKYQPHKGICPMPFNKIIISYEGYLTMCCLDYQNYLTVADLNHCTIKDAWNNENACLFRQKMKAGILEGLLCSNCLKNKIEHVEPLSRNHSTYVNMEEWGVSATVENRIDDWMKKKKHRGMRYYLD